MKMIYLYNLFLFVYKATTDKIKCNIEMRTISHIHNYNTRRRHNFYIEVCRTNKAQKNVFKIGLKLYNKLPNSIKSSDLINFKEKIKKYIFENYSNLVNEL